AELPRRAAKKPRPRRHGVHFWLTDGVHVALRRRPPDGLLGGMEELPGTPWRDAAWDWAEAAAHAPAAAAWRPVGEVRHVFTHFELSIAVHAARVESLTRTLPSGLSARRRDRLAESALPSVMRKCAAVAEAAEARGA
ncbi:NUDIX domain-containing protein, partial [Acidisphaera rubrifaciens]|uniref:NUDIX domain-containing protein n=1 Tax=Acidisphaera rubrifaciens TaxID=50715 RepID=UPI0006620824